MILLEAVHQIPDTGLIPGVAVDHPVIVEHLDMIQQLHEPVADFRIPAEILEHIRPEAGHGRVRRHAGHDPLEQRDFLGLLRHFLHQGVQPQVMPCFRGDLLIGHPVLVGEEDAEL